MFTVQSRLFAVALAVAALAASVEGRQQATAPATPTEKLEISAFAVNMSNIATGANAVIDITINSWTPAAERTRLATVLMEKGDKALLSELQKAPSRGRFRIPGLVGADPHQLRLGHDLRYTWVTPQPDGGRRIVIVTDRYIGFAEARNQPRTFDYPFTLFEIHANANGEGEGKVAVATKITFDKKTNTLGLENYASEPVRLQNVRVKVAK